VWFVSDEIYHGLTYGMSEQMALASSEGPSSSTASPSTSA
jgi:hypothetical protein